MLEKSGFLVCVVDCWLPTHLQSADGVCEVDLVCSAEILQEPLPGGEPQPDGAARHPPEGDGGVHRCDAPTVNDARLPKPAVCLNCVFKNLFSPYLLNG